jgi:hypothetical protein
MPGLNTLGGVHVDEIPKGPELESRAVFITGCRDFSGGRGARIRAAPGTHRPQVEDHSGEAELSRRFPGLARSAFGSPHLIRHTAHGGVSGSRCCLFLRDSSYLRVGLPSLGCVGGVRGIRCPAAVSNPGASRIRLRPLLRASLRNSRSSDRN